MDGNPVVPATGSSTTASAAGQDAAAYRPGYERVAEEILRPMIEAASLDHGETRAALVTSHLVGIAYLRYVLRVEPDKVDGGK